MGTSKSYIPLTKPEYTAVKRKLTSYLKNKNEETRTALLKEFSNVSSSETNSNNYYIKALTNILGYVKERNLSGSHGANDKFKIDKEYDNVLDLFNDIASIGQDQFGIDGTITAIAIKEVLDAFGIITEEDLDSVIFDDFAIALLARLISAKFEQRYYDLILKKLGDPTKANNIMIELKKYIINDIDFNDNIKGFDKLDFTSPDINKFIENKIINAYETWMDLGE